MKSPILFTDANSASINNLTQILKAQQDEDDASSKKSCSKIESMKSIDESISSTKEMRAYDESENFNSHKKKSTNRSDIEKASNLLNDEMSKCFEKIIESEISNYMRKDYCH